MVDKVKIKKWLLFGVAVVGVAMVIFGVVYGIVNDEEEPGVTSSAIIDTTTQSAGPLTTSSSSFESTTQSADLQMIPCFTDSGNTYTSKEEEKDETKSAKTVSYSFLHSIQLGSYVFNSSSKSFFHVVHFCDNYKLFLWLIFPLISTVIRCVLQVQNLK